MNPYIKEGATRLRITLPVSRTKAWEFIGTARGIARWFPAGCVGKIAEGENITFDWGDGKKNTFRVLSVHKNHSMKMSWFLNGTVEYALEETKPITLTLKITYPKKKQGREDQLLELPCWGFFLANLKSIALTDRDLRSKKNIPLRKGYID